MNGEDGKEGVNGEIPEWEGRSKGGSKANGRSIAMMNDTAMRYGIGNGVRLIETRKARLCVLLELERRLEDWH